MAAGIDQKDVEAALSYAARVENGFDPDRPYEPWLVILAQAYREASTELRLLRQTIGLTEENDLEWREAITAQQEKIDQRERMRAAVEELLPFDLNAMRHMELDGEPFRLLPRRTADALIAALGRLRDVL